MYINAKERKRYVERRRWRKQRKSRGQCIRKEIKALLTIKFSEKTVLNNPHSLKCDFQKTSVHCLSQDNKIRFKSSTSSKDSEENRHKVTPCHRLALSYNFSLVINPITIYANDPSSAAVLQPMWQCLSGDCPRIRSPHGRVSFSSCRMRHRRFFSCLSWKRRLHPPRRRFRHPN